MRSLLILAVVFCCMSGLLSATPVYGTNVDPAYWTDTRTIGSGLAGTGDWAGDLPNIILSWEVSFDINTGLYTYAYTFSGVTQGMPSHLVLELSAGCASATAGCVVRTNSDPVYGTYSGSDPSNPNMPAPIYGVKLNTSQWSYTVVSGRVPVWGNFYSKDGKVGGQDGEFNAAWNIGLALTAGEAGLEDITNYIPRPDSDGQVPEPSSYALIGAGLLGIRYLGRRLK